MSFHMQNCVTEFFLKYTIDKYHHILLFSSAESEFDNHISPTRIDLAVQEIEIFAFLLGIKRENSEQ